ncbi:MAG: Hsp20/alpha crystallin family protein [Williamsia sp.]|nr:Hsp20/alpha crystallin family protein [Williamsia sp.]
MCYYRSARWGDRFAQGWEGHGPWGNRAGKSVPVNIQENEKEFELFLYAPGLQKEAFKVSVKDDVLTVAYTGAEEQEPTRFTRREYRNESFERSFVLNGKVQIDSIKAAYADGILKIILAKDPTRNQPAQTISVA